MAEDWKAQVQRAREFEYTIGRVTFRCRLLTMDRARRIYARYDGPSQLVEGMQDIVAESVRGIRGATLRDLGLDSDDALPDTAEAAREYLADHIEASDALLAEITRRSEELQERIRANAKN